MKLGANIARLRKFHHITSMELAKRVGVTQSFISEIENGKKYPRIDLLQKIAQELDTTTSELLGEVPAVLSEDMLRLVDATKDLTPEQIDALISVVRELGPGYGRRNQ
jgi:transcriptional regulator with XRE-family HTH domain